MTPQQMLSLIQTETRNGQSVRHAVVIGAGISGLCSARVLADHFDRVTIVERDPLPKEPESRKGVPQSRYLHVMLAQGRRVLEKLFPGLDAEMDAAGAPQIEFGADTLIRFPPGWLPRFHSGVATRGITRGLLEWMIRQRVCANDRIRILEGAEVIDLAANADHTRVTGLHLHLNGGDPSSTVLSADLIVDASGRSSHAPGWLSMLGYPMADETIIKSHLGYASRMYRIPENFHHDWKLLGITFRHPDNRHAGSILPVEGNRWNVLLVGIARAYPPTDNAGFLEFIRTAVVPHIYEELKNAEALTPAYGYRATENRFRHYERLTRWPDGFLALGDSVCVFNPYYGQGMTVGAMGALTLDQLLREDTSRDRIGLSQRFQKELAKTNQIAWLMATGEDLRWPETEGGQPGAKERAMYRFFDRVLLRATQDLVVARSFLKVMHMLTAPTTLMHPSILLRMLRPGGRNGGNGSNGHGKPIEQERVRDITMS